MVLGLPIPCRHALVRRRCLPILLVLLATGCQRGDKGEPTPGPAAVVTPGVVPGGEIFVDDAGRTVTLPEKMQRVYPAGPPAMVLVYVVARESLVGWPQELPPGAERFMPAHLHGLPRLGRLTGRGGNANIEALLARRPDLVLDYGTVDATSRSLADRVQAQTGVPYVLLDGSFDRMPAALRNAGRVLGEPERGERLAVAAEAVLARAKARRAEVPAPAWPRLYLARGPQGLETGGPGCINAEVLDRVPAANVAGEGALPGAGLRPVSFEDVLRWQPDWVLTGQASAWRALQRDERWAAVPAVQAGKVRLAPTAPFGWLDQPPSVNRLLGVEWLLYLLDPAAPAREPALRAAVSELYRLFYQHELTAAELDGLLAGGLAPAAAAAAGP